MSGYWAAQDKAGTSIMPEIAQGPRTGIAENFEAARQDQLLNNNGASEYMLYGQAYADRIKDIEEKTGQRLNNPITYIPVLPGDEIVPGLMQETRQGAMDEFEAEVTRLREQYPDLASRDDMVAGINARSQSVEQRATDTYDRAGVSGTIASFGGAMVGSLQDPLVGSSIVFGAAKGFSILKTAITEAVIGGATETLVQPNVQSARRDRDLDGGMAQALTNIGFAAGGAGVLGGASAAVGKYLVGRNAIKVFDETVKNPTPEQKAARNLYERVVDINETSPLDSKAPGALKEHGTRLEAAMRSLDEGEALDLPAPENQLNAEYAKQMDNVDLHIREFDRAVDLPSLMLPLDRAPDDLDVLPQGRFHGSSGKIKSLDEYSYNEMNIYGQGFYTTNDFSIAQGYTKKGGGSEPTIYNVAPREGVEIFDLDQVLGGHSPVLEGIRKAAEYDQNLAEALEYVENDYSSPKFRHIYDELRELDVSADTVQESMDNLMSVLENNGYHGVAHKGGNFTGNKPHDVVIYFNPQRDLQINEYDPVTSRSLIDLPDQEINPVDQARQLMADLRSDVDALKGMQDRLQAARNGKPDPRFLDGDGRDPAVVSGTLERTIRKTEKDIARNKAAADEMELREIPVGEYVDPDTGEIFAETRTIKDILDELEQDELDLQAINVCGIG